MFEGIMTRSSPSRKVEGRGRWASGGGAMGCSHVYGLSIDKNRLERELLCACVSFCIN